MRHGTTSSWLLVARQIGAAAAVAATALAVTACGSEQSEPRPVALVILDQTASFGDFAPDCARDFGTVAEGVAERRGHLYGGPLLTGHPFAERFSVEKNFDAKVPASIEGNGELELGYRRRQAKELAGAFDAMARTEPTAGGSPVLTTLARASNFRLQRAQDRPFWLVVCSDLANTGDDLDTRRNIDDAAVSRATKVWTPRLKGLKGADLYFVGAGRLPEGSDVQPDAIHQIERILREIARRVGARVRLVDTQLGDTFPIEGT